MRLGKQTIEAIEATVKRALGGPCVIDVPAPPQVARRVFDATRPHVEQYGAISRPHMLSWQLPNGSAIRIVAHGENAEV